MIGGMSVMFSKKITLPPKSTNCFSTKKMKKIQIIDRFDSGKITEERELPEIAEIIQQGTRTSNPRKSAKGIDQDQSVLTMRETQALHRQRMADGHKPANGTIPVKQRMPLMAIAAHFSADGRTKKNILQLTGMAQIDVDDHNGTVFSQLGVTSEELLERAKKCAFTVMTYRTISGGLRIIYSYPLNTELSIDEQTDQFERAWIAANAYYAEVLGLPIHVVMDTNVGKPVQLAALAHDPLVYLNEVAPTLPAEIIKSYYDAGEKAYKIEEHRQKADKKHSADLRRVGRLFEQRIRDEVEDDGAVFMPGHHNDYVARVGYVLNQFGINEQIATEWAVSRFAPDYDEREIMKTLHSCYQHTEEHGTRASKTAASKSSGRSNRANITDIKAWLDKNVRIRYNLITGKTEWQLLAASLSDKSDLSDQSDLHDQSDKSDQSDQSDNSDPSGKWLGMNDITINSLLCHMSEQTGMKVRKDDMECVIKSDYAQAYNPFEAYLSDIEKRNSDTIEVITGEEMPNSAIDWTPQKGGVLIGRRDYISELAQSVHVKGGDDEQRLWTEFLRKWLVGMVAAWLNEEVVNEIIPVLIGRQGSYKTTWFKYLLPPALQAYYQTLLNGTFNGKDDTLRLNECALICIEEVGDMTKRENEHLKSIVSVRHTSERVHYDKFKEQRAHVASFCATSNNTQFLTDHTGNRRWMPFEIETIENPYKLDYHHDKVFLQALLCYRNGYRYYIDGELMELQAKHNAQFEVPNVEQELILKYYRKPQEGEAGSFVTVSDALTHICPNMNMRITTATLGRAFAALGFVRVRKDHGKLRGYRVIELSNDEVLLRKNMAPDEREND